MQARGSPIDSGYVSTYSNGAVNNATDVEFLNSVQVRGKLQEITVAQEDVSQARQDLLVERSRIRSAGEAVRSQRIVTGNVEGQFFTVVRDFYNSSAGTFPPAITEAYERVVQERDRLGSVEDDYLEAERTLGGSEWRFMENERMLYQYQLPDLFAHMDPRLPRQDSTTALRPPPPPEPVLQGSKNVLVHNAPPPPPQPSSRILPPQLPEPRHPTKLNAKIPDMKDPYQLALVELDKLKKEFDSLRPQQSNLLELEFEKHKTHAEASVHRVLSQEFFERYSALLTNMTEKEVEVQRLRQTRLEATGIEIDTSRRKPDEWILNYVKANPMERALYINYLEEKGIPTSHRDSLDEWSERYWFSQATDSSSGGGQDFEVEVDHRSDSSSASSGNIESTQVPATSDVDTRPTLLVSLQSHPVSTLHKHLSNPQTYPRQSGHSSLGGTRNDTAGNRSDSAMLRLSSNDLRTSGGSSDLSDRTYSRPFVHRRSWSTPAISDRRKTTDTGSKLYMFRQFRSREITC